MISNGETGQIVKNNTPHTLFNQISKLCIYKVRGEMEVKGGERFLDKYTLTSHKEQFLSIILKPIRTNKEIYKFFIFHNDG